MHHGYLGISMNDVTPDNASFFNLPDATGAIVSQVTPDSPAGRAGLKSGDVLRELNGKKIAERQRAAGCSQRDGSGHADRAGHPARRQAGNHQASRSASSTTSKLKRPKTAARVTSAASSASPVANLTPDLRQQLNVPEQVNGAAIEQVRPGSPADDAGLAAGDVILEVDRHPVRTPTTS